MTRTCETCREPTTDATRARCSTCGHHLPCAECAECDYLQKERAGMMMSDGLDQTHADKLASRERCAEHSPPATTAPTGRQVAK